MLRPAVDVAGPDGDTLGAPTGEHGERPLEIPTADRVCPAPAGTRVHVLDGRRYDEAGHGDRARSDDANDAGGSVFPRVHHRPHVSVLFIYESTGRSVETLLRVEQK